MEKENPYQPSALGWWRHIKKEVCETKQITITRELYCKPDTKKKPPLTSPAPKASEGEERSV